MAKKKIQDALKDVRNTTTMIKKFVDLLKTEENIEEVDKCLEAFHALYNKNPYYDDVRDSILTKVEALGMDADHVSEIL